MTVTRTYRLAAALAALTLTAAACSNSTVDSNVTADIAADVAAAAEVTTPAPTTTTPAVKEPTATTAPTTSPTTTTTTTEAATDGDVDVDAGTPNDGAMSIDADEETTQPNYENRHPDSVLPDSAYLDHDAIRALFPECPPAGDKPDWAVEHEKYWTAVFENWDTEVTRIPVYNRDRSKVVVSGWWTDEQIDMEMPGSGMTAASVRADALYNELFDTILLYGEEPPPDGQVPDMAFGAGDTLYERLLTVGFEDTVGFVDYESLDQGHFLELIRRDGVAGYNTTTDIDVLGTLLWEWMIYRRSEVPIDEEPTAWGVKTLLDTRQEQCVAGQMLNICNGDRAIDSPLLEPTHRIGRALRSIVCEFER